MLIAGSYADRMLSAADLQPDDVVLEIGPGLGILTGRLAARCGRVIAVELDEAMVSYLTAEGPGAQYANVDIVHGDILTCEVPPFTKCVSNLPYHISSPVTFWLLEQSFDRAVLMYQTEFAQRMTASPGGKNYSRLTVNTYYRAVVNELFTIPSGAFFPRPKVTSTVVSMIRRPEPPFALRNEQLFDQVVAVLFQGRRKKIANSLLPLWPQFAQDKQVFLDSIRAYDFADHRVEELAPEQIGRIADILEDMRIC